MAAYIALLLAKAAEMHPRIVVQPTDNDIFAMTEVLFPILHSANYAMIVVAGRVNHNLIGLIQLDASYTATWTAPFPRPVCLAPYDPNIPKAALPVTRHRMEAAHTAIVTNFEICTASEKGVAALIQAVVDKTWIKPFHNPVTYYN